LLSVERHYRNLGSMHEQVQLAPGRLAPPRLDYQRRFQKCCSRDQPCRVSFDPLYEEAAIRFVKKNGEEGGGIDND
jgi:hypothetical protein